MSIVTRNSRASVLALAAALIIPAGLLAAQAPAAQAPAPQAPAPQAPAAQNQPAGEFPKVNLTDKLSAIECPTLIIVGDQDVGTPVAMSEAIHDAVRHSQLVVLKNASHLSNLEQTENFNSALDRFLAAH